MNLFEQIRNKRKIEKRLIICKRDDNNKWHPIDHPIDNPLSFAEKYQQQVLGIPFIKDVRDLLDSEKTVELSPKTRNAYQSFNLSNIIGVNNNENKRIDLHKIN